MVNIDLNEEPKVAEGEAMESGHKKKPRNPRWTIHESLIMLRGTYAVENSEPGPWRSGVPTLTESGMRLTMKWPLVSAFCREYGVRRTSAECETQLKNLVVKFRLIRAWEAAVREEGGVPESYWVMSRARRRERKLPGLFRKEIYELISKLEVARGDSDYEETEARSEPGNGNAMELVCVEQGDHNAMDLEICGQQDTEKSIGEGTSAGGRLKRKANDPSRASGLDEEAISADVGGEKEMQFLTYHSGGENTTSQLINAIENNSKILKACFEAQTICLQEDREERNKQTNSLIAVLSKLTDAITKIAEKF